MGIRDCKCNCIVSFTHREFYFDSTIAILHIFLLDTITMFKCARPNCAIFCHIIRRKPIHSLSTQPSRTPPFKYLKARASLSFNQITKTLDIPYNRIILSGFLPGLYYWLRPSFQFFLCHFLKNLRNTCRLDNYFKEIVVQERALLFELQYFDNMSALNRYFSLEP